MATKNAKPAATKATKETKTSEKPAAKATQAAATSNDASKKLTQTEIITHLSDKSKISKVQIKEFMTELANFALSEVKRSGEFTMPGFGKLKLSQRKEREGRNPSTGAKIKIPAKTTLKFQLSKGMKDGVDGNGK